MGRLIDADKLIDKFNYIAGKEYVAVFVERIIEAINKEPTVEAIPKDKVYKAIQEMMKYEHEGFINISLVRLDEILKKYGVCEKEEQ